MPYWISVSGNVRVPLIQVVTMDRGYIVAGAPLIPDLIEKRTQMFGRRNLYIANSDRCIRYAPMAFSGSTTTTK